MMTLKSFSDLPASTPEKLKSDILEQVSDKGQGIFTPDGLLDTITRLI